MTKRDFERLLDLRKIAEKTWRGTVNKFDYVHITACKNGHCFAIGSCVTILYKRSSNKGDGSVVYLAVNVTPERAKEVNAQGLTFDWGSHAGYSAYYIQDNEFEVIYSEEVEE